MKPFCYNIGRTFVFSLALGLQKVKGQGHTGHLKHTYNVIVSSKNFDKIQPFGEKHSLAVHACVYMILEVEGRSHRSFCSRLTAWLSNFIFISLTNHTGALGTDVYNA